MAYYVINDDDCRYEGMTKEQIIAAIAEATGSTPTNINDAFITKVKEINANKTKRFWIGTEAQFNALSPAPTIGKSIVRIGTDGILYLCSDDSLLDSLDSIGEHASTHYQGGSDPIAPSAIGAIPASEKGAPKGVATLDDNGLIPSDQIPAEQSNINVYTSLQRCSWYTSNMSTHAFLLAMPNNSVAHAFVDASTGTLSDAPSTRGVLLAQKGTNNFIVAVWASANSSDIWAYLGANSTTAGTWQKCYTSADIVPLANGGTEATTAPGARAKLGLGTAATRSVASSYSSNSASLVPLSMLASLETRVKALESGLSGT